MARDDRVFAAIDRARMDRSVDDIHRRRRVGVITVGVASPAAHSPVWLRDRPLHLFIFRAHRAAPSSAVLSRHASGDVPYQDQSLRLYLAAAAAARHIRADAVHVYLAQIQLIAFS